MSALHELAAEVGLQIDWRDASGQAQRVRDEVLVDVLEALGFEARDERTIAATRRQHAEGQSNDGGTFLTGDVGTPIGVPFTGRGTLLMADGSRRDVAIENGTLPAIDLPGYHRLMLDDREVEVAVAPKRCFTVADAAGDRRIWGAAIQIASLRDERGGAYGDFGSLREAVAALAGAGADAAAISPVHALFPADASRYSPYAPSSRLFLNILYADPAIVGLPLHEGASPDLIDWQSAIPARLALLRQAFDARTDAIRDAVAAFAQAGGEELQRHARFDALHAHFFADGATGWQGWPAAFHDPSGAAVAGWAHEHAEQVDFYLFCQWLADRSLSEAQAAAKSAGMAVGLIADLAVGMDSGGSHAWSRPDDLITGLSIGAPPDLLGPDGQNWGITGFAPTALRRRNFEPFRATLRSALNHAGGIRIDHAMGLERLWVVPDGKSAADGAYLSYPLDDMLRVLAIESHAAQAIVIGEDLGTVPEGFRPKLDSRAVMGMRVMPFEADGVGNITPPDEWAPEAAAMTGTHDLPTIAGWWRGRDIELTYELHRSTRADSRDAAEATRAREREGWWNSFTAAGTASGKRPAPDDFAPVIDAALGFVGRTPCAIAVVPLEDVAALVEQPNLPGTIDEHPNWRRRMPDVTGALLDQPAVASRLATLNKARTR
jgi:4-alpha-glucanotransferase